MLAKISLDTQLEQGLDRLGLALPASTRASLLAYLALLARWNVAFNLTAVRQPEQMVVRHLLDSLAILPWIEGETLADLGSGAGLPGIPLAIAQPSLHISLLDANGKKVRFLRMVRRELGLTQVEIVPGRIQDQRGQYDCITTRALGSLDAMLAWGGHLLAPAGCWLAMKGKAAEIGGLVNIAPFYLHGIHRLHVPSLDAERHLVIIKKSAQTGNPTI